MLMLMPILHTGTILDADGNVSTSSGEFKKSDLSVRPIKPWPYAFHLTNVTLRPSTASMCVPSRWVGHTDDGSNAYSFRSLETFVR